MSEPAESPNEYDAIESAVMESPRGRSFLAEFARRIRAGETDRLLEAIERLYEAAIGSRHAILADHVRRDLEDMRRSIEETRNDIAAIKPREAFNARFASPNDLEALAAASERATRDMLAAVERLQNIGDELRGQGADADLCDEIETHARGIFMASSFQDMTGQRTTRLATALRYLEQRVAAVLASIDEDDAAG